MGELRPLGTDLREPMLRLAEALRVMFGQLQVSLTRYAAQTSWDKSSISRFLSGERVPPWAFVHDLLVRSAAEYHEGAVVSKEVVEHLRSLHRAALEAGGTPAHRLQLLEDKLAQASEDAQRAVTHENVLESALHDAQQRVAQLRIRELELQTSMDQERAELKGQVLVLHAENRTFQEEREKLLAYIATLEFELAEAHRRRLDAEQRCSALEHHVEDAEQHARVQAEHDQAEAQRKLHEQYEQTAAAERARAADLERELRRLRGEPLPRRTDAHPVYALGHLSAQDAIDLLTSLPPKRAVAVIGRLAPERAVALLRRMDPMSLASVLERMPSGSAAKVIEQLPALQAILVFDHMSTSHANATLDRMDPSCASAVLNCLPVIVHTDSAESPMVR